MKLIRLQIVRFLTATLRLLLVYRRGLAYLSCMALGTKPLKIGVTVAIAAATTAAVHRSMNPASVDMQRLAQASEEGLSRLHDSPTRA